LRITPEIYSCLEVAVSKGEDCWIELPQGTKQEKNGEVGGRVRDRVRGICYFDAAGCAGFDVYVVVSYSLLMHE
jgi:hypothetical protein